MDLVPVNLPSQTKNQLDLADRLSGSAGDHVGRRSGVRQRPDRGIAFFESADSGVAVIGRTLQTRDCDQRWLVCGIGPQGNALSRSPPAGTGLHDRLSPPDRSSPRRGRAPRPSGELVGDQPARSTHHSA